MNFRFAAVLVLVLSVSLSAQAGDYICSSADGLLKSKATTYKGGVPPKADTIMVTEVWSLNGFTIGTQARTYGGTVKNSGNPAITIQQSGGFAPINQDGYFAKSVKYKSSEDPSQMVSDYVVCRSPFALPQP